MRSLLHFLKGVLSLPTNCGHYARVLHRCTDHAMTAALAEMDLIAAQGRILGYLTRRETPPCSRDIEEEFHLSHPTVSGLLSRLEKKGFLEFRPDPQDRRCKRICILEKGLGCHRQILKVIRSNEERILQGFTPEEQAQFANFLQRAVTNMGGNLCCRKHKEETETHD